MRTRASILKFRISSGVLCAAILATVLSVELCLAQPSNQPPRVDYSAFRIIPERNIFNPRRYARSGPQQRQPAARVDAFTLVGTIAYEKGPFAFFEGSSPDYRKVAKVADDIAGYRITNIQYNSVTLAGTSNEVRLAVGMQMRREEEGPWRVAASADSYPGRPSADLATAATARAGNNAPAANASADAAAPAGTDSGQDAAASGEENPVLKRLMQRREQEMNR